MIYLEDGFSNSSATGATNTYGAAVNRRAMITGVHFEHCSSSSASSGPCRVLKDSSNWILAGTRTSILVSTQFSNAWLPPFAPYKGISYLFKSADAAKITDPGHATMATSTNASLSLFGNTSHSSFSSIGEFSNVAEICSVYTYPSGTCPAGKPFDPFLLLTGVEDGDGVPDATDNCPTVFNAGQQDTNNNGVGDACESAPTVIISPAAASVAPGGGFNFTTTAADADDPLSSLTYEWRVDGLIQAGATDATGTSESFNFPGPGPQTVRVTVRDPGLLSGFDEATVTVISNQAPVCQNDSFSMNEDTVV